MSRVDTGVVLGLIGLALGLAAFTFTAGAWVRARSGGGLVVSDEGRERAGRDSEPERLEITVADRDALSRAGLTLLHWGPPAAGPDGDFSYRFTLGNRGPSWAKHVTGWLVEEGCDEVRDSRNWLSSKGVGKDLSPGDRRDLRLRVAEAVVARDPKVRLVLMWYDDRGGPYYAVPDADVRLR